LKVRVLCPFFRVEKTFKNLEKIQLIYQCCQLAWKKQDYLTKSCHRGGTFIFYFFAEIVKVLSVYERFVAPLENLRILQESQRNKLLFTFPLELTVNNKKNIKRY
jgi:hypothetical protein